MFTNNEKFTIHKFNKPCNLQPNDNTIKSDNLIIKDQIDNFLSISYPKNKSLHLIFNIFLKHNLINDDLFFKMIPNIHIADFCSFINNRFDKDTKPNKEMIKLCKYLQTQSIRFPKVAIKNPVAQKLLN